MDRGRPRESISLVDRPTRVIFGGPEAREFGDAGIAPMELKNPRKRPPPADGPSTNTQAQKKPFEKAVTRGERKGEAEREAITSQNEEAKASESERFAENTEITIEEQVKAKRIESSDLERGEIRGKVHKKPRSKKVRDSQEGDTDTCSSDDSIEDSVAGKILEVELNGKADTNRKVSNTCKIYRLLKQWSKEIEAIRMTTRRRAEVVVKNDRVTREIMRKFNNGNQGDVRAFIPNRVKQRWGVVNDWDGSLKELEEEIVPGQNILAMERMKKRRKIENGFEWSETKAIKISYKGASLPTKLVIMDGFVNLKITPYIRNVRQCFGCLRFGHIKKFCRNSIKKCFNCGEDFHGNCERSPRCVNCKGEHGSLYRECKFFQLEQRINKAMAYKNLSFEEARRWARTDLGMSDIPRYDDTPAPRNNRRDRNWAQGIPRWEDQPIPGARNDWKDNKRSQFEVRTSNRYNPLEERREETRPPHGNERSYDNQGRSNASRSQGEERRERIAPFYERGPSSQSYMNKQYQNSQQSRAEELRRREQRDTKRRKEREDRDFQDLLSLIREKGWEDRIQSSINRRITGPPVASPPPRNNSPDPFEGEDWMGDPHRGDITTTFTKNKSKSGGLTARSVRLLPNLPEDVQEERCRDAEEAAKNFDPSTVAATPRAPTPRPLSPVAGGSGDHPNLSETERTASQEAPGNQGGPPDLLGAGHKESQKNEEPQSEEFASPATDPDVTDYLDSDEYA